MHAEKLVLGEELRDVALGILHVAEVQRLGDAGIHACRGRLRVHARLQSLRYAGIDALDAESALGGDPELFRMESLRFALRRAAVGKRRLVHLEPRLIRTGDGAVAAADAQVVIDGDDAVGPLARSGARAHVHARRVVAVHAAHRHERALHIRILADLEVDHAPPLHAGRRRIRLLARRRARLAADAAAQIRDHGPARHAAFLRATRTRSAPEPVASVSSSDIGTSGFIDGNSKPLANGVTQWPNWPSRSSVSGRIPWRSTARARTSAFGVAIRTQSPWLMPSSLAFEELRITPPWPATLSATSLMSCMPTFPPHAYCMERAVRSQNG